VSLLNVLIGPVAGLLDKFIPDADTKAKLAHDIATMAEDNHQALMLQQMEINKLDAQSGNWWQAGWRPFFGWICGIGFANNFIFMPYASAFLELQPLDWAAMSPVVMGMLGLATNRTVEKVKGKQ